MLLLLPWLLGTAPLAEDQLNCSASFFDAGRMGIVTLWIDRAYTPRSMQLQLNDMSANFSVQIAIDPMMRALPGTLTSASFTVGFTRQPRLPMTMRVYADDKLRWQRKVDVAWEPRDPDDTRSGPASSHRDYVTRADDGLAVPTPNVLRVALTDASGRSVADRRYRLPGSTPDAQVAAVLASVDARFRNRQCFSPPPLID